AAADGHEAAGHLPRAAEDTPRVVVAEDIERLVERFPPRRGDPLVGLGHRLALGRLEQEEVAELVDVLAAEAEVPVAQLDRPDEGELLQPSLLGGLGQRRLGRGLTILEMPPALAPVTVTGAAQPQARRADPPA